MAAQDKHSKLRRFRENRMITKSELARKAGLSVVTIDRVERGYDCRLGTKRKILEALGLKTQERTTIFEDELDES